MYETFHHHSHLKRSFRLGQNDFVPGGAQIGDDHIQHLPIDGGADLPALIGICDEFLGLPERDRWLFILARRMGWMGRLRDFLRGSMREELARRVPEIDADADLEQISAELRMRMV